MTKETTICSTMFCYNRAEITNDPAKPPFCEQCQDRNKKGSNANLSQPA